jgi:hypothetical protein
VVYAFLPDPCGLLFNGKGDAVFEVSKNTLFYTVFFIFVIIQILFMLYDKVISIRKEIKPNLKISTWLQGMILSINLFIILILIFIGLANNAVDYSFSSIRFLAYVAPLIVIIWLLSLPFFIFLPGNNA